MLPPEGSPVWPRAIAHSATAPPGTVPVAQDLYARLYLEEKIRDGAENMLHELEAEMQHHSKLKARPSGNRKQVLAQLRTAKKNVEDIKRQISALGDSSSGLPDLGAGNKSRTASFSTSASFSNSASASIHEPISTCGLSSTGTASTGIPSGAGMQAPTNIGLDNQLGPTVPNMVSSESISGINKPTQLPLSLVPPASRQKKAPLRIRANLDPIEMMPGPISAEIMSPRPHISRGNVNGLAPPRLFDDVGTPDPPYDDGGAYSSPIRPPSLISSVRVGASPALGLPLTSSPPKGDPNCDTASLNGGANDSYSEPDASHWFASLMDSLSIADDANLTISRIYVLSQLLTAHPSLRNDFVLTQICEKVRLFLLSKDPALVAVGYRLVRLVLSPSCAASLCHLLCLDYSVERSLAREGGTAVDAERNQALLLVRALLADTNGDDPSSLGLIRALVAVAENQGDRLQQAAIETLAEITVMAPGKAYLGGAFPLLLKVLVDGSRALAMPIAMVMANLLDRPDARIFLHDGKDLACVASIFTEPLASPQSKSSPSIERISTAVAVIITLLRSWAGFESFNTAVLVQCLLVPKRNLQEALLSLFLAVFGRKDGRDFKVSKFTKHFTARVLQRLLDEELMETLLKLQNSNPPKAVQVKTQELLGLICCHATEMVPPELLQQVIDIPSKHIFDSGPHSLPLSALTMPITQIDSAIRGPPAERIHSVEYYNQIIVPWSNNSTEPVSSTGSNSTTASPGKKTQSSVWAKVGSQMDDSTFKQLVNHTHVLTTKVYSRWNWDSLLELIEGPLYNPKRLDELSRTSKFMKRLLSFYRPFKFLFSNTRKAKQNYTTYVHVGKVLLKTLLATAEGRRYLSGNKLLRQIAECLAQLDPESGIISAEPLLSPQRLKSTLSSGYFEFLGALSSSEHGRSILGQLRVWNMLYNIFDTDREDVIRLILASLDYSFTGHPRLLLRKALQSGPVSIRVFSTELLPVFAIRTRACSRRNPSEGFWIVKALVDQLYDLDMSVCAAAVKGLLVLCRIDENVDHFIALNPSIAHLGAVGDPLYMLFLSRKAGFESLSRLDFVTQKMDHWVHGSNEAHVELIEDFLQTENLMFVEEDQTHLATLFSSGVLANESMQLQASCPSHFFGDIVLTEEGANLLMRKGYISTFASFVEANIYSIDPEVIVKLKGCLWTLGHVGSRSLGAELITLETVEAMCALYTKTLVRSLQATAFFAIGLISTSFEGAEMLRHCGWGSTVDSFGKGTGIALIVNKNALSQAVQRFDQRMAVFSARTDSVERELGPNTTLTASGLTVEGAITGPTNPPWMMFSAKASSPAATAATAADSSPATSAVDGSVDGDLSVDMIPRVRMSASTSGDNFGTWSTISGSGPESGAVGEFPTFPRDCSKKYTPSQAVLRALSDLGNHILAHEASKKLVALRAQRPQLFQNSELFRQSLDLIARYRYKQLVRRFLFELFDTSLIVEKQMRRRAHQLK